MLVGTLYGAGYAPDQRRLLPGRNVQNPAIGLPTFCTMKNTEDYALIPGRKYLRLSELYNVLFDKAQPDQHNALSDARAAAECFF